MALGAVDVDGFEATAGAPDCPDVLLELHPLTIRKIEMHPNPIDVATRFSSCIMFTRPVSVKTRNAVAYR